MIPLIKGEKTILRLAEDGDLESMVAWNQKPEIAAIMGWQITGMDQSVHNWYHKLLVNKSSKLFAVLNYGGELIGSISVFNVIWKRKEAEITICIGEARNWDKGYGSDAIKSIINYAFSSLSLDSLYLRVYSHNKRAINCYIKCGFKFEGMLKRSGNGRQEIYLMRIMRSELAKAQ